MNRGITSEMTSLLNLPVREYEERRKEEEDREQGKEGDNGTNFISQLSSFLGTRASQR